MTNPLEALGSFDRPQTAPAVSPDTPPLSIATGDAKSDDAYDTGEHVQPWPIPADLPPAAPCGDCGDGMFWLSCYDDGELRCWTCEHPPALAMIGIRLLVCTNPDGTFRWEASPAVRWVPFQGERCSQVHTNLDSRTFFDQNQARGVNTMGSDYLMQTIDRWETINGVEVPVSTWGTYLDHENISEDRTKALDLTTPCGILEYAVGNGEGDEECDGDWMTCFDFAELPDGRIVLDATINSDSGGFIESGGYEVCTKEDAPSVALGIVDLACECLALNEVRHDAEGWNQDEYYFVRAVAAACGIEPYASAKYGELRRGDRPEFDSHGYMRVLGNG